MNTYTIQPKKPLIKSWYILMTCIASMVFSILLLIDHYTAKEEKVTIINYEGFVLKSRGKYSNNYRISGYLYNIKCNNEIDFSIESEIDYLNPSDTLLIKYTPFFKIIHNLKTFKNGKLIDRSPPTGIFTLLLVLTLIILSISIITPFIRVNDVMIKLVMMNILLILLTYYIYGRPNYFESF